MKKVTMVEPVNHDGKAYEAGKTYSLEDSLAANWLALGVASKEAPKEAGEETGK